MEDQYLLIDQYLNGELSGTALEKFIQRMEKDEAFAAEVNLYKSVEDEMRAHFQGAEDRIKLENTLAAHGEQYFTESQDESALKDIKENWKKEEEGKVIPFYKSVVFRGICSIAAILLFTLLFYNPWASDKSSSDLFATYQDVPEWHKTTRGDIPSEEALLIKAQEYFVQENYSLAAQNLTKHNAAFPNDAEGQFYLGVTYLELGNGNKAIPIFEKLVKGKSSYRQAAQWQMAMTYLKLEEFDKCKAVLNEISSTKNSKTVEAKALLKEIP